MRKLQGVQNFSGDELRKVFDAVTFDQPGLKAFLGDRINSLTDREMRHYLTKCHVEKALLLSPTQVKVSFNGRANDCDGKAFVHVYAVPEKLAFA